MIEGKHICLICNKVFDSDGAIILHNSGDHTIGIDREKFALDKENAQ